ncbi:Fic family protein [Acidaminococcus sp.]|uniref:Fic family protein n=1 Tax=Acidaminococcus sp. TaxID=1872103 RepID=UPI003AB2F2F8
MHYKEALWSGYQKIKEGHPLTINTFIELFQIVKERQDGIRSIPGTCLKNGAGEVIYTPPDNKYDILRLLGNLETFINVHDKDDIDSLIKLAILHYQFECIHPFPDGNGRVGRILNVLYLVQEQLLNFPILYLSRYIIENKTEYYRALKGVTENQDWERWILYVLDSVEQTAKNTLSKVKDIHTSRERMAQEIKNKLPSIYSKELVDFLFEQPYCKISFLVSRDLAKAQTASKYLRQLLEAGFLDVQSIGREKYYINRQL